MAMSFMSECLLLEKTVQTGSYIKYEPETNETNQQETLEYMVLDSQSLQHLEILEAANGDQDGSLFNFINHCKSNFGKR